MSDFRKLLLAFAVVTLLAGIASAQVTPPIVCSTTAQPLTVRTEGLAEQTGDVLITCTGGQVPNLNDVLPQVNISVTLSTNITSRLLADPITEALLFIDDPQPGTQSPCAPAQGSTVCSPLRAGTNGRALDASGINRNVFQGVRQSDNTIVWLAVPVNAPGSNAQRLFRTKNIRAAIAGASAANGQIFAYVSIQNPPANLQLNNSSVNVAFVQQGLAFAIRSRTGGGFSATTQARTYLFQCDNVNRDLAASNTARYTGSPGTNGRSMQVRFREAYAASWKVRDIAPPLTEPGVTTQQNFPQLNNGAPQSGNGTVVESGFYNTTGEFPATNGLNRAGRADHGTRLRVAFSNVPANIRIYVSVHSLSAATFTENSPNSGNAFGGGESSTSSTGVVAYGHGVATDSTGRNIAAGTVLANPTSDAELYNAAGTLPVAVPGATNGIIEVPIAGGAGNFTWEVFNQDPNSTDTLSFSVAFAYRPTNNPGLGQMNINGSFAPVGGGNTMSSSATLPRFADQSTANAAASMNVCQTNLLFPFVTNQAGFDTGLAISNTSADIYGTAPQSGTCTLNYFGATTGGGAAPAANTTTSAIDGGGTLVGTLSSGGSHGLKATPGFQGYIIATCNFRYAHGFAFISDVGSQKLAEGYLALILDNGGRTGLTGEALAH